MRDRFSHLAQLESFQSREDPNYAKWSDTRLDRWLVDWALRIGKEDTARKIAEQKQIEVRKCYSMAEYEDLMSI